MKPVQRHLQLGVRDWSLGELNVPPYAEMQSYTAVLSAVCRYSNNSPEVVLTGWEKNTFLGKGKEIRKTCSDILVVDHR